MRKHNHAFQAKRWPRFDRTNAAQGFAHAMANDKGTQFLANRLLRRLLGGRA